jgi:hypothetical protein
MVIGTEQGFEVKRAVGIEPTTTAWKAKDKNHSNLYQQSTSG